MVMIDEYFLNVNVGLIAGMSSSFCVTLRSGADGYPVGAFLKFVTRKTGRTLSDAFNGKAC